jgi:membrane peptidoglycan carboxypeptidase
VSFYTILLEDRRFFRHPGFDARSIIRVVLHLLIGRRTGGASTIEQLLVRTLTKRYEHTPRRKLREIVLAYLISRKLSKLQILNAYLEVAYMGTGIIGANAASLTLFGKMPQFLDPLRSAVVASTSKYPRPKEPTESWKRKIQRRAEYGIQLAQRRHSIEIRSHLL